MASRKQMKVPDKALYLAVLVQPVVHAQHLAHRFHHRLNTRYFLIINYRLYAVYHIWYIIYDTYCYILVNNLT